MIVNNMIFYFKNPKEITKKILELIKEFNAVIKC